MAINLPSMEYDVILNFSGISREFMKRRIYINPINDSFKPIVDKTRSDGISQLISINTFMFTTSFYILHPLYKKVIVHNSSLTIEVEDCRVDYRDGDE